MARWLTSLLLLAGLDFAHAGVADGVQLDSIRCGRQVVEVGDRSWQVIEACGEPDHREVVELRQGTIAVEGPDGQATFQVGVGRVQVVEEWVYRPGSGRLTRVLLVVGGVLTEIRVLGRN